MKTIKFRQYLSDSLLIAQLIISILSVPDWKNIQVFSPTMLATMGGALTTMRVLQLRWMQGRGSQQERLAVAGFLLAMPIVYFWSHLLSPASGWMLLEALSLLLFITMAVWGYFRSVTLLAIGIIGHGFVQDLPHYFAVNVVPQWYALECFVVDLCFGLAILLDTRVRGPGK